MGFGVWTGSTQSTISSFFIAPFIGNSLYFKYCFIFTFYIVSISVFKSVK